jgi:hypothetical protein
MQIKISKTNYFNSLCVNLNQDNDLIEIHLLKFFTKKGHVKDNYLEHEINECTSFLCNTFLSHFPMVDELTEISNNINNLIII